MTVVGQVEIDGFCRRVLAKHWPEVARHDDVRSCVESGMTDLLELLTEADRTWALRHRVRPAPPAYLVHLVSAAAGDPLDRAAEVERLQVELDAVLEHLATLVCAVTGRWSKRRPVARQVADALKQLLAVEAFLESLHDDGDQARAG